MFPEENRECRECHRVRPASKMTGGECKDTAGCAKARKRWLDSEAELAKQLVIPRDSWATPSRPRRPH